MTRAPGIDRSLIVIAAGVGAALHAGKLPPAVTALQDSLGMSLVQAGFALSLMQMAGMLLGVAFGALADGIGLKRSMVLGLALLGVGSTLGGAAPSPALLLATRVVEGFGFLLVVLPAPALLRQWALPGQAPVVLGLWGAYMPFATALALLTGPGVIDAVGWRPWWWLLAVLCAGLAVWLNRTDAPAPAVGSSSATKPASPPPPGSAPALSTTPAAHRWPQRLALTLRSPGPWLVALSFAMYSGQWLAVVGFLPTIYAAAGLGAGWVAVLSATVAAANIAGNIGAGRALARGVPAPRLIAIGFVTMALSTVAAFATLPGGSGLPPALRYATLLLFSAVGGLIPGTLFSLAVRVAPSPQTLATTVGWMQQWSAFGQFAGPPAVAWITTQIGSWESTWQVTAGCSAAGLLLSRALARHLAHPRATAPATHPA